MPKLQQHVHAAGPPHLFPELKRRISAWSRGGSGKVCVVRGPYGSGKTQLAGRALDAVETIHLVCLPGMLLGEVFEELSLAFLSLGDDRLHRELCGESNFTLQLETIKEFFSGRPGICLWLDNVERLGNGSFGSLGSQSGERGRFFDLLNELSKGPLELLFSVSNIEAAAPALAVFDAVSEVALPKISPSDTGSLWESFFRDRSAVPPVPDGISLPLECRCAASLAASDVQLSRGDLAAVFPLLWERCSEADRCIFSACAATGFPITQGLIKFCNRELEGEDNVSHDLLRFGILESGGETSNRFHLNPAFINAAQEQEFLPVGAQHETLRLFGRYWEKTGKHSKRFWDTLRAVECYHLCGDSDALYETQRPAVEALLSRGFFDISEEVLQWTMDTTEGRRKAVVLGNLAIVKKNKGEYETAVQCYKDAWIEFEKLRDLPNTARVLHQLGNISYLQGDMATATGFYEKCSDVAHACNDKSVAAAAQIQTANIHFVQGQMVEAIQHYRSGLEFVDELHDRRMKLAVLLQLGQAYFVEKSFLEADATFKEALNVAEELGDAAHRGKLLQFRGLTVHARGDYHLAVQLFTETITLSRRLHDPVLEGTSHYHLAQTRFEQGHHVSALEQNASAASILSQNNLGPDALKGVFSLFDKIRKQVGAELYEKLAREAGVDLEQIGKLRAERGGEGRADQVEGHGDDQHFK